MSATAKSISIHYAENETGWATPLGDGTYRLDNIPLVGGLNIDDIVTLKPGDPKCCPRMVIDAIVKEVYPHKVQVHYEPDSRAVYRDIWHAVHQLGGKCEGHLPGLAGVAVHDTDALKAALGALLLELDTPVRKAWFDHDTEEKA